MARDLDGNEDAAVARAPGFGGYVKRSHVKPQQLKPQQPGLFHGRISAPPAGAYNLSVSAEGGAAADEIVSVVSDARHPVPAATATVEALTSVSSITRGISVRAGNLEPLVQHFRGLPSSLTVRQVHPARTMSFLIAFVALASAEWTMRRRRGLR